MKPVTVTTVVGGAIAPYVEELARLRARLLRGWPFLQDGGVDEERARLRGYVESWRSVVSLVHDDRELVGASSGLPLADAPPEVRAGYAAAGIEPEHVFHFGPSILLAGYRGRGLGHCFFDQRESHARSLGGFRYTAFCAVQRPATHPLRPPFGHDHAGFWRKRGYAPRDDVALEIESHEVGQGRVLTALQAWLRPLERTR